MPEKKWVFDTVSLSNFLLADSLFILEKRYSQKALITSQVYDEIYEGIAKYDKLKGIDALIENNILRAHVLTGKEREIYSNLVRYLGKGEASCIAVAREKSAIVVTDDKFARSQCYQMDITVTGTIGILKASILDGSISVHQADDVLRKMIKSGFYSPVRKMDNII